MNNMESVNSNKPLVSVIIGCYNHGDFIAEAVQSVKSQTYTNWELVIVEDGSTDGRTPAQVDRLRADNIKVIHTENKGLPSARNTAIRNARGDLILPLDADDKIAPDFLEKTVPRLLGDSSVGVVGTYTKVFGYEDWTAEPEFDIEKFIIENQITATSLFRKADWEKVGGYLEDYKAMEDYALWLAMLNEGKTIEIVPEYLFFYRKHKPQGPVRAHSLRSINQELELELRLKLVEKFPKLYAQHLDALVKYQHSLKWHLHYLEQQKSITYFLYNVLSKLKRLLVKN